VYYVQVYNQWLGWQVLVAAGASLRSVVDALGQSTATSVRVYERRLVRPVVQPVNFTSVAVLTPQPTVWTYVLVASGTPAQALAQLGYLQRAAWPIAARVGQSLLASSLGQGAAGLTPYTGAAASQLGPPPPPPNPPHIFYVKRYYPAVGWQWVNGSPVWSWADSLQSLEPLLALTDAQGSALIAVWIPGSGSGTGTFWQGTGTGVRTYLAQCLAQPNQQCNDPWPVSDANIRRRAVAASGPMSVSPWASPSNGW
jgi:hypothetical protein